MCGRYVTLSDEKSWAELHDLLTMEGWSGVAPETALAYPGSEQCFIQGENGRALFRSGRWGWYRKKKEQIGAQYNTCAESLLSYYPELAESQRALVPFVGFVEGAKSKHGDQLLLATDKAIACAAAIWKALPDGRPAFSILTTHASASVKPFHHRMPLVLGAKEAQEWISGDWQSILLTPHELFEAKRYAA